MDKSCLKQISAKKLEDFHHIYNILKVEYGRKFDFLSESPNVQRLNEVWKSAYDTTIASNKEEFVCLMAHKMLQKDSFALAVYQALPNVDTISFQQAFENAKMNTFLEKEGLTDDSLAFLNGVVLLGDIDNLSE